MLVEIRDIEAVLRRDLTEAEANVLPQIVELVEGDASLACGRPIEHKAILGEAHLLDLDTTTLRLVNSPVWSIEGLRIYSTQQDSDADTDRTGGTALDLRNITRRFWGIEFLWSSNMISTLVPVPIQVDYTAGLDSSTPGYVAIRGVVAQRIKRILNAGSRSVAQNIDPSIVEMITVEGYSVKYRSGGGQPWTSDELDTLGSFHRPLIV